MFGERVIYRVHAVQRMFERAISAADVEAVLRSGEEIESYPADSPYPSRLLLGITARSALHVVAAYNAAADETIVITVYVPDPKRWSSDLRRRKK